MIARLDPVNPLLCAKCSFRTRSCSVRRSNASRKVWALANGTAYHATHAAHAHSDRKKVVIVGGDFLPTFRWLHRQIGCRSGCSPAASVHADSTSPSLAVALRPPDQNSHGHVLRRRGLGGLRGGEAPERGGRGRDAAGRQPEPGRPVRRVAHQAGARRRGRRQGVLVPGKHITRALYTQSLHT